jgi:NAD-dependent deacetylase
MGELIREVARLLVKSNSTVALTGAGISVESGIPPFRGKGGVWEKIDPMKYAHIDAFINDPEDVWRVLIREMAVTLKTAEPNDGHKGLAALETMGLLATVITQNVDGLHQVAGNSDVIEFHGSFAEQRCMDCRRTIRTDQLDMSQMPPHCECGGIYRPDVIFFGEAIPPQALMRSQQLSAACDLMLVIGTSGTVQPAALMPVVAKQRGATIVEINPESTPLTDRISDIPLLGPAGEVMNAIVAQVEKLLS